MSLCLLRRRALSHRLPFPADLFPSLDPSRSPSGPNTRTQRGQSPLPDSRGSRLGPEAPSSEVHSTCLRAAGVPSGGVRAPVSAPQPRPCPPRSGRGWSPAFGLHRPRSRQHRAAPSRLPQANPGAAGPHLCAHRAGQGADGRVPEARAGTPCKSSRGELGVRTTSALCHSPGTGRSHSLARPGPGSFPGGLRSEGRSG